MSAATGAHELGTLERPLRREGGCYVRACGGPAEHLRPTATGPFVSYCTEHQLQAELLFGTRRGGA